MKNKYYLILIGIGLVLGCSIINIVSADNTNKKEIGFKEMSLIVPNNCEAYTFEFIPDNY